MKCFLVLAAIANIAVAQQVYDLVLKGGHVIDPKNGIDAPMDVAIQGGRIAAVSANIAPSGARRMIDVTGLYVTPGLLDIRVHVFHTTSAATTAASHPIASASVPGLRRWSMRAALVIGISVSFAAL